MNYNLFHVTEAERIPEIMAKGLLAPKLSGIKPRYPENSSTEDFVITPEQRQESIFFCTNPLFLISLARSLEIAKPAVLAVKKILAKRLDLQVDPDWEIPDRSMVYSARLKIDPMFLRPVGRWGR